MNAQLVEEASKVVPSPQILVNMLSQRVRQLNMGHRPMVDVGPFTPVSDIALQEIIEGKLQYQDAPAA